MFEERPKQRLLRSAFSQRLANGSGQTGVDGFTNSVHRRYIVIVERAIGYGCIIITGSRRTGYRCIGTASGCCTFDVIAGSAGDCGPVQRDLPIAGSCRQTRRHCRQTGRSGWAVIQTNPVRHNRECGEDANLDCCQRLHFGSDCHDSYGVTIYSIILPNFSF